MHSFAVSRINIIQCVRRPYRKGLQTHLAWRKWAQQPKPLSNSADHKTAQSPSSSSLRLQWWAGAKEETTAKILVGFLSMQYNWIFKCNASMLIKHATASRAVAGMVLQFQSSTRVNFTIKGAHWKNHRTSSGNTGQLLLLWGVQQNTNISASWDCCRWSFFSIGFVDEDVLCQVLSHKPPTQSPARSICLLSSLLY